MPPAQHRRRVGTVRPSHLMFTGGVGALIDLPNFPVLIRGLDDWRYDTVPDWAPLPEPRLQAAARIWFPDGNLIDQTECDDYLRAVCTTYNVGWVAADEAWWPTLGTLEAEGLPIFRMPQQGRNMIIAYGMTYRVIVDSVLVHDGDPLFTDQIASAVPQSSDRGWTLRKGKHNRRIDACPALAGAVFATTLEPRKVEPPIPRSAVY